MGDAEDFVRAAWTLAFTLIAVFVAATALGFWLLYRRNARAPRREEKQPVDQRANILLVRLDDAVASGEDELSFAIAQFGDDATNDYARALAAARANLAEAFTLQQRLDDAHLDSPAQRRDWTARIIHLCESAQADLAAEQGRFDQLRQLEKNAPTNLATVRALIAALTVRRAITAEQLTILRAKYAPSAIASVADNLPRADDAITAAQQSAESAAATLGDSSTTATVDAVHHATEQCQLATQLFDAIADLTTGLSAAADAVDTLTAATRVNVEEARAVRDNPPDAAVGAALGKAVETAERTLSSLDRRDPIHALDELREAGATLDSSLAGARNQQQRLEGARTALAGALVAAQSQLSVTKSFVAARRGRVGAEARTRLAEAERLLMLAEVEADPVLALDTARSSATFSRDADALARFDIR